MVFQGHFSGSNGAVTQQCIINLIFTSTLGQDWNVTQTPGGRGKPQLVEDCWFLVFISQSFLPHCTTLHCTALGEMYIQEENLELINTVVFTMIAVVILIVLIFSIIVIVKSIRPDLCLCGSSSSTTAVTEIERKQTVSSKISSASVARVGEGEGKPNNLDVSHYITLEDHLDLLDTPVKALPRKRESHGYTLEFFPEDNTVVQIEGRGNKITKITKTKITFGDKVTDTKDGYSVFSGEMNQERILIFVVSLKESVYDQLKSSVMDQDKELPILTPHPRYLRYLGTCFNPQKQEAYVISDYIAGCSLLEIQKNSVLRELLELSEEDKVQAAVDVVEAVYYIHNLSTPVVHQNISAKNVIIDGETHRARLRAPEIHERLEDMIWCLNHGGIKDFFNRSNILHMELAPEIFLAPTRHPDIKSDIWSLGASVLEIIFDKKLWNPDNLMDKLNNNSDSTTTTTTTTGVNTFELLQKAMEGRLRPCLVSLLDSANPGLKFLSDCLSYSPPERPSASLILKELQSFLTELDAGDTRPGKHSSSHIFPGQRLRSGAVTGTRADPLIRQQVEWSVRQEAGFKRRAFLVGNRNYLGKQWASLSANPSNDIKDMESLLRRGGYATDNTYENVSSAENFEEILRSYIDVVNKEAESIDIILFYFAGYGLVGEPEKLRAKKAFKIFTDREGVLYDCALVMCNETIVPVAKIQVLISQLSTKVKRKMIIIDNRISSFPPKPEPLSAEELLSKTLMRTTSTYSGYNDILQPSLSSTQSSLASQKSSTSLDWDLPKIPEETTEKLNSMFILKTALSDTQVILKAVDSHPRKMNGFLTGCLLEVLTEHTPNIQDIPKFLNNQMKNEARRSRAHRGIECRAEFSKIGNIWNAPLLV